MEEQVHEESGIAPVRIAVGGNVSSYATPPKCRAKLIRACSTEDRQSRSRRAPEHVAEMVVVDERQVVDNLLGAAHIVCQAPITHVVQAALSVREHVVKEDRTSTVFGEKARRPSCASRTTAINRGTKVPKIGDRAKPSEVRARWAYSELTSPRFASHYKLPQELFDKANAGTAFEDLLDAERAALEGVQVAERSGLWPALDRHPEYECKSWTVAQVCRCLLVPALDPQRQRRSSVPLVAFLASPRFPEATDPRNSADKEALDAPFVQKEAAIVVKEGSRYVIIDGTIRCILFLRSGDLDAQLLVWVPV